MLIGFEKIQIQNFRKLKRFVSGLQLNQMFYSVKIAVSHWSIGRLIGCLIKWLIYQTSSAQLTTNNSIGTGKRMIFITFGWPLINFATIRATRQATDTRHVGTWIYGNLTRKSHIPCKEGQMTKREKVSNGNGKKRFRKHFFALQHVKALTSGRENRPRRFRRARPKIHLSCVLKMWNAAPHANLEWKGDKHWPNYRME